MGKSLQTRVSMLAMLATGCQQEQRNTPPPTPVATATSTLSPTAVPIETPATSDRESLVICANQFLKMDQQLCMAVGRFDTTHKADLVKASDTFVKQVEASLPRLDALVAPQVPYAQTFLDRYRAGAHLYYEGMMKITWAASDRNAPANVLPEAFNQLTTGSKNMEHAFWEFKAAIEKQASGTTVRREVRVGPWMERRCRYNKRG